MKRFGTVGLIIAFGASLAIILFIMQWLQFRIQWASHSTEVYIGILALIFTALGIWLALTVAKPKTVILEKVTLVEKTDVFRQNVALIEQLGLSERELEVLHFMSNGLTNQQIADQLFVSLNTVKTHIANLFSKLDVNRRTQAIDFAKKNSIIQ